jgi:hypothetical protein
MADASAKVPYLSAYGNITKVLDKVKDASEPDRFTTDFLATKLGLSGGGVRPIIPLLKRAGLLASDGTPTALYRSFRNDAQRGAAAAQAVRNAYAALYELNEYVHDADDKTLKGLIVQLTGMESDSPTVKAMVQSFKALRAYADFETPLKNGDVPPLGDEQHEQHGGGRHGAELRLGYTINLQLPNTTDIAVFNAIFKSLREHLID